MPETAYCMHCRKKVPINNVKWSVNARGTPMVSGACSKCGGKVFGIVAAKNAPADIQRKAETVKKSHSGKKKKSSSKSGGRAKRSSRSRGRK